MRLLQSSRKTCCPNVHRCVSVHIYSMSRTQKRLSRHRNPFACRRVVFCTHAYTEARTQVYILLYHTDHSNGCTQAQNPCKQKGYHLLNQIANVRFQVRASSAHLWLPVQSVASEHNHTNTGYLHQNRRGGGLFQLQSKPQRIFQVAGYYPWLNEYLLGRILPRTEATGSEFKTSTKCWPLHR